LPSVRQIKRRIRSVENTAKITKAMSMIAASKMRRTQEAALKARPYSNHLQQLLSDLAAQPFDEEQTHPLLQRRNIEKAEIIVITPDRGLTGGLNSNINRTVAQFLDDHQNIQTSVVAVGKKGRDFMNRTGQNIKAVFTDLGDRPSMEDLRAIATIVNNGYSSSETDAVYLAYAEFVSTVSQKPIITPLLPIVPAKLETSQSVGYIYEPSTQEVLSELLPRFVEMKIYQAVLEATASEQSARMVAMRNATDNASQMVDELTLIMNKARQESITTELLDIVSGAAAVEA